MEKKYFLKGQSSLQRKIVAGGLSVVFGVGVYGSYVGAMLQPAPLFSENELGKENVQRQFLRVG